MPVIKKQIRPASFVIQGGINIYSVIVCCMLKTPYAGV